MTIQIAMVTIDSTDPRKLAEFWTKALGVDIAQDYAGEMVILGSPAQGVPSIGLQRVAEPRTGKNRVHVDFHTDDREAETDRLVGLGASILDEQEVPGLTWTVLADPEGNEFCVGQASEHP